MELVRGRKGCEAGTRGFMLTCKAARQGLQSALGDTGSRSWARAPIGLLRRLRERRPGGGSRPFPGPPPQGAPLWW